MNRDFEIDLVFKALGDPTRRKILDIIKNNPGTSMNEISDQFEISRFGVRKHMLLLEEANLISFQWERPTKRFYLNAIPIQMIYDRWIAEYSKDRAERLTRLKYDLEELQMSDDKQENAAGQTQVYVVYIRCPLEKLWRALTESEFTRQYYMGCAVQSDFKPGAELTYVHGENELRVSGKVTEFEPQKKFAHTFHPHGPDGQGPESIVTYELEVMGENVKLTVTHARLTDEGLFKATAEGWPMILNGLKSLLETGEGLRFG